MQQREQERGKPPRNGRRHPGRRPAESGPACIELVFGRGDVNLAAVSVGSIVWKTDDPAVRRRLEQSFSRDQVVRRRALKLTVEARIGQPLRISVADDAGHQVQVMWEQPLAKAEKHPLTIELIREQFGRLGQTPYELGEIEAADGALDPVMAPKSVLNDLRRQAVERLAQAASAAPPAIAEPDVLERMRQDLRPGAVEVAEARLCVLARTMQQLEAVLAWKPAGDPARPAMVYCDFEDIRRYKEAVAMARAAGVPIGLATVRVIKPGEEGLLRQIADCRPDAVLVRNLGGLEYFRQAAPDLPLIGDYSLNVANEITAALLAEQGLVRLTPSYDLNWKQLVAMLGRISPGLFEAVIHQHMPMFHMEHCVFAACLSNGKDYRDCGRPCERHQVDLRDRMDVSHPLVADVGCRNTVYNGQAQSAAELATEMRRLGIRYFRVELLRESAEGARDLLDRYQRVLAGEEDGRATWRQLRVLNQLGVTRGTLDYE